MPPGNLVEIAPISDYPEDNMRLNGGLEFQNDFNPRLSLNLPYRKQMNFSGSYSKQVLSFRIGSWQFYGGDVYGKYI